MNSESRHTTPVRMPVFDPTSNLGSDPSAVPRAQASSDAAPSPATHRPSRPAKSTPTTRRVYRNAMSRQQNDSSQQARSVARSVRVRPMAPNARRAPNGERFGWVQQTATTAIWAPNRAAMANSA